MNPCSLALLQKFLVATAIVTGYPLQMWYWELHSLLAGNSGYQVFVSHILHCASRHWQYYVGKKRTCTSIHYVERYKKSSSACTDGIPQKQPNDTRIHSHHPCILLLFSNQAACFAFGYNLIHKYLILWYCDISVCSYSITEDVTVHVVGIGERKS